MKVRTRTLIGPALDWAVATCEGYTEWCGETEQFLPPRKEYGWVQFWELNYSTSGALASPIIEREKIEVRYRIIDADGNGYWVAGNLFTDVYGCMGDAYLVAAMRCHVTSKRGDEVEIPDELFNLKGT